MLGIGLGSQRTFISYLLIFLLCKIVSVVLDKLLSVIFNIRMQASVE